MTRRNWIQLACGVSVVLSTILSYVMYRFVSWATNIVVNNSEFNPQNIEYSTVDFYIEVIKAAASGDPGAVFVFILAWFPILALLASLAGLAAATFWPKTK